MPLSYSSQIIYARHNNLHVLIETGFPLKHRAAVDRLQPFQFAWFISPSFPPLHLPLECFLLLPWSPCLLFTMIFLTRVRLVQARHVTHPEEESILSYYSLPILQARWRRPFISWYCNNNWPYPIWSSSFYLFTFQDCHYLAMEFMLGGDLQKVFNLHMKLFSELQAR